MSDTQATVVPRGTGSRTGKLAAAAGPMLSMIFVLRKSRDLDRHPDLHGKVVQAFEDFRRHARDGGVPAGDLDDASYALAATLDETMLLANWAGRDQWQADSMARRYCNNEFVGLGFYDKLAQVRRSVPARAETLEIFYYCLVAGFQGKLVESPKELADLTDQLARELASADSTVSPTAYQKVGRLEPLRRFPWLAVVVTCVALPFFVWFLTWSLLDRRAAHIVDTLRAYHF
ncbi:MAG: type IVB secretion system protein IcmH/DotU [Candidatus Eisenbacteria bacterium]|uniref:Type IVB secretion system protein IcmH/DotU n=1 Tax=Eiseniibacteriota bacterium TaxID=2212470 RepID=A0A956RNH1_UNCEI|nr:type IVB secretion system protein IcmH/DotU [Candidatus Eisenbacteria bacterium]